MNEGRAPRLPPRDDRPRARRALLPLPELQDTIVHGIPDAEQVILEESSHMPVWEERTGYMAAVSDFLARHD